MADDMIGSGCCETSGKEDIAGGRHRVRVRLRLLRLAPSHKAVRAHRERGRDLFGGPVHTGEGGLT